MFCDVESNYVMEIETKCDEDLASLISSENIQFISSW